MKLIKLATLVFIVSLLADTLISCRHDGEYDYSNISVTYYCTEDVLDLFTPKVLIDNGSGNKREIVLQKEDFKHYDNNTDDPILIEGTEAEKKAVMYCVVTERIDNLQGDFSSTLVFDQLENREIDDTKNHLIFTGLGGYSFAFFCQDGHCIKNYNVRFKTPLSTESSNITGSGVHILSHIALTFDLKYKINTIDDDDIVCDSESKVTIGSR